MKIKVFLLVIAFLQLSCSIVFAQIPPNGTVIADDTGPIWVVINGQKRWIRSPQIMHDLGWDVVPIKKITPAETQSIPSGPDLTWAEPAARAIYFIFPKKADQMTELGDHCHMHTTATFSANGTCVGVTRIWTDKKLSGFTGGAIVCTLDETGNILSIGGLHSYGVDGKLVPKPSDRTEQWTEQFTTDGVAGIGIVNVTNATDRFMNMCEEIRKKGKAAIKTYQDLKSASGN